MPLRSALTMQTTAIACALPAAEISIKAFVAPPAESNDLDIELVKSTATKTTTKTKSASEDIANVPNKKVKHHGSFDNSESVDSWQANTASSREGVLDDKTDLPPSSSIPGPEYEHITDDVRHYHACEIGRLNDEPSSRSIICRAEGSTKKGMVGRRKEASYYLHGGGLFDIFDDLEDDETECSETEAAFVTDDESDLLSACSEDSDHCNDCCYVHPFRQ